MGDGSGHDTGDHQNTNVHSVVPTGRSVVKAGTNGLSLINTIQSVAGIDLDTFVPNPYVAGKSVLAVIADRP